MTVQLALLLFFAGTAIGAGGVFLLVRSKVRELDKIHGSYQAAVDELKQQLAELEARPEAPR